MSLNNRITPLWKRAVQVLSKGAQAHPFIWKFSWEFIHHIPFLLPHDRSYKALRHFMTTPPGLFLDVGANDGISILSLRAIDKECRIFSLEPNQLLEPALAKRKAADSAVDYRMVGAGDHAVTAQFFTPVYKNIVLHTFTSTDEAQVRQALRVSFGSRVADKTEIRSFTAEIITVDSLHLNPTIIKIDAEGHDYQVLVGARETITKNRPYIMVEMAWQDQNSIQNFIKEMDYELYIYRIDLDVFEPFGTRDPSRSISGTGGMNCFLIPKEKVLSIPRLN